MNRQIVQLFGLSMLLFATLVGLHVVLDACSTPRPLKDETANRRPLIEEQRIPRGLIRASDGTVIARSVGPRLGRGQRTFTRTYPTGPLFSHAVGYSFIERGRVGLERRATTIPDRRGERVRVTSSASCRARTARART